MKKLLLNVSLLASMCAISQNKIEVYPDSYSRYFYQNIDEKLHDYAIPNLEAAKDKTIRIWRENELFVLANKSYYVSTYKDLETGFVYKFKHKIDKISLEDISIEKLRELENFYDLETKPVMVEIADSNQYFTRVFNINGFINGKLSALLKNEILTRKEQFEKNLPEGTYVVGTNKKLTIKFNKNKSSFEKALEIVFFEEVH
nr:hypothetical protein [uncultured Flavobacterium sp.]